MQWKSKEKQEQVTKIRAKEKNKMNNLRNGESLETVHTHTHTHTHTHKYYIYKTNIINY